MGNRMLDRALKLFEEERAALRAGQIVQVAALASQKQALADELQTMRLSADQVRTLQQRAHENAQLLAAALKGLKDAQSRLSALKDVREGLRIYDAKGDPKHIARPASGLEQKL